MNAPLIAFDHDEALNRLAADTFKAGASTGIMEAHKLLQCLQEHRAAEALLRHWDSILARSGTHWQAQQAIAEARGAA